MKNHHGGTAILAFIVLGISLASDFTTTLPLWAAIIICGKLDFVMDEIRIARRDPLG